jgi:hypothetical protein
MPPVSLRILIFNHVLIGQGKREPRRRDRKVEEWRDGVVVCAGGWSCCERISAGVMDNEARK